VCIPCICAKSLYMRSLLSFWLILPFFVLILVFCVENSLRSMEVLYVWHW
jgi:hypothetical protein